MTPAMLSCLQAAADAVAAELRDGSTPAQVIAVLVGQHAATWNTKGWNTNILRVAGVTATCTWSKDEGLLAAWRKNAALRLMNERTACDTRPTHSAMPKHLAAVYDRHAGSACAGILSVFRDALEAGKGAPAAERENDAFSLANQVASLGLFALAAEMAERKQVPIKATVDVLLRDFADRLRFNLELSRAARQATGATRQ